MFKLSLSVPRFLKDAVFGRTCSPLGFEFLSYFPFYDSLPFFSKYRLLKQTYRRLSGTRNAVFLKFSSCGVQQANLKEEDCEKRHSETSIPSTGDGEKEEAGGQRTRPLWILESIQEQKNTKHIQITNMKKIKKMLSKQKDRKGGVPHTERYKKRGSNKLTDGSGLGTGNEQTTLTTQHADQNSKGLNEKRREEKRKKVVERNY